MKSSVLNMFKIKMFFSDISHLNKIARRKIFFTTTDFNGLIRTLAKAAKHFAKISQSLQTNAFHVSTSPSQSMPCPFKHQLRTMVTLHIISRAKHILPTETLIFHFLIIRRTKCYGWQVIRSVSGVLHSEMKWRCFILWSGSETMLHRQAFMKHFVSCTPLACQAHKSMKRHVVPWSAPAVHEAKPDGFMFFCLGIKTKKWSGWEESRFIFCKFFISIDLSAAKRLCFVVHSVVRLLLLRLAKYSALSAKVKW